MQLKSWVRSSMSPETVSNTIKGLGTTVSGVILIILASTTHPVSGDQITMVVNQLALLGGQIAGGLGAAWTLYGLIMKGIMYFGISRS